MPSNPPMHDELNLNLLRAYLDGELSPEEASRIEARLADQPHWRRALEAEGELREHLGRVMSRSTPAPAALREQILADARSQTAPQAMETDSASTSGLESRNEQRIQPSEAPAQGERPGLLAAIRSMFNGSGRVSFSAVAMVVILVAAVVLVSIFAPGVDDPRTPRPNALLAAAAEHISREHDRCAADDDVLLSKMEAMTAEDGAAHLQKHLNVEPVTIVDLSHIGYHFVGVGPCSMPGSAPSAHLVYRRQVPGEPESMMSIFVTPDLGQFPSRCKQKPDADKGRWSGVCGGKGCSKTILHGSDDQLVYFLACGFADQVQLVSKALCESLSRRGR